jgi:proline dehydrogenase
LDDTCRVFCEAISLASKAGSKSGIAIKVSALIPPEVILKTNVAQVALYSLFSSSYGNLQETLTAKQVWNKLQGMNVEASFEDLKEFLSLFLNKQVTAESDLETVKISKFEWLNNMHAYYIYNSPKNANKILHQITKFTSEDLSELSRCSERLDLIFKKAHQEKSTVLVDAEQTYIQLTIDSFTLQYSEVYNKENAIVLNTFQNYLKSTMDRVNFEIERCKALNIPFGAKLVRGAYMVEERRLAKELNYPDPIHDTVENTHACYNMNLTNVIKNWIPKSHLMVASHNEHSNYLGKSLVKEYNITEEKGHVSFIQLLGLADHLTYSNADQGLTSAKYVPFGPIPIMIPYLIRRAQESKQMLSSASLQRKFVLSELAMRLRRS